MRILEPRKNYNSNPRSRSKIPPPIVAAPRTDGTPETGVLGIGAAAIIVGAGVAVAVGVAVTITLGKLVGIGVAVTAGQTQLA
jgi:hypothetical protein